MTRQELMKAGLWDFNNYCPLPGCDIDITSDPTKDSPARPDPESEKDIQIRRLEGRCKQMSQQLRESNIEIVRLRQMHHLEIAGYVKHDMVDMMQRGNADHTRIYATGRQQFNYPVYRVRIKADESAT